MRLSKILGNLYLGVPLLTLGWAPLSADVYTFKDSSGVVHLTNIAPDKGKPYRIVHKELHQKNQGTSTLSAAKSQGTITIVKMPAYSPKNPPKSRIVRNKNSKVLQPAITQTAYRYKIDPKLLNAIITVESAYNPGAVSEKGAVGLMQLMPGTAKRYGVADSFDPTENIEGGARYVNDLLDRFSNLNLALAAYNAGEGAVTRYGDQIPPYRETQDYVNKVMQLYSMDAYFD